jgi:hypothetical protein
LTHSSWPRSRLADCSSSSFSRFFELSFLRFPPLLSFFINSASKTKRYARVCLSIFFGFLLLSSSLSLCVRVFSFGGREWCHDRRVASRRLCFGCGDRSRAQFHFGASQFRSILSTLARGTVTSSHRSCVSPIRLVLSRAESILRTRNCLKFEHAIHKFMSHQLIRGHTGSFVLR